MADDTVDMSAFRGQTAGLDVNGNPVRLGEFDSMGHIVGFIDEDGNCWESVIERDRVKSAGRFHNAMCDYKRGEGEKPDPVAIAKEVCLDQNNIDAAINEIEEDRQFVKAFKAYQRQSSAKEILDGLSTETLVKFIQLLEMMKGDEEDDG